ncbi:MAG: trypsin-like peptidase domain-containing protein [Patescibacteria group bacterium]|nr:trypsin-like peptidase domain-containing protein [Patescibacteria group bacterium]MDD4444076.1 trypsin-like peptidase domain-containing protein [Patescibacteria group bacterium]NCU39834.1 trypsin-like serine protease [Candidatus Falkowbacteria bacterium]
MNKFNKSLLIVIFICSIVFSSIVGGAVGYWTGTQFNNKNKELIIETEKQIIQTREESDIVSVVEKTAPAVVSVVVTKDLPKIEEYYSHPFESDSFLRRFFGDDFFDFQIPQYRENGTYEQTIGGGTGFIVSEDGFIVTNKHVVSDEEAQYTVVLNDETKYEANVIARDPMTDFAVLKIEAENLPVLILGESEQIKVGQTVIAIGNALGEFSNTVSVGVISGLSRSIVAGSFEMGSEQLSGVIQTDASINHGNSGGPLLNLRGEVIGINTAIAQDAQNIGFAIPINEIKNSLESVKTKGRIIRPWLGVRYVLLDEELVEANKLPVDYGALIARGETLNDLAVIPGSPAHKAGLVENDIILEINGNKINKDYPLAKAISEQTVGSEITLKVWRADGEKEVSVILEEMKE